MGMGCWLVRGSELILYCLPILWWLLPLLAFMFLCSQLSIVNVFLFLSLAALFLTPFLSSLYPSPLPTLQTQYLFPCPFYLYSGGLRLISTSPTTGFNSWVNPWPHCMKCQLAMLLLVTWQQWHYWVFQNMFHCKTLLLIKRNMSYFCSRTNTILSKT